MSTTVVEQGADWQILWDGCPYCGSPTKCPKWIVTGTLSCQPYPCLCKQTRQQAYEDHGIEDASCWWRDKKRAGKLASRCPCWGRMRDDSLPQDCCSRHDANPQYVIPDPARSPMGITETQGEAGEGEPAVPTQADGRHAVGEAPAHTATSEAIGGPEAAGSTAAYTRLWPASESTCTCKTPWDGQKTVGGYHCVGCCRNFVNVATAMCHQPTMLHPCLDPASIVDVDTRRPLLYARDVRGATVWAFVR